MADFKELVVKANELIEMPVDFNLMQLKLFAKVVVSMRDNPEEEFYTFAIKSLLKDFDLTDTNYTQLKLATKGLIRPVVIKGKGGAEQQKAFFTDVNYDDKGIVEFKIHPDLKPLILDLEKNYTKYYFSNIARLKSAYAIRFYELLKQYQYRGERILSLQEIRIILRIDDSKYKQYGHFKAKVITVAQKELNEKTDIFFEFEEIKEGRKIVKIKFLIYKNSRNAGYIENRENETLEDLSKSNLTKEQEILKIKLIDEYKLSKKIAIELIQSVSVEQIEKNIVYTQNEHKKGKVSQNFSGYLLKAIKDNYASKISLFEEDEKKRKDDIKKTKALAERKGKYKEKLSKEFSKEQKEIFISSLNDEAEKKLIEDILEEVKLDSFAVAHIKKKGLSSPSAYLGIIKRIDDFEGKRDVYIKEKMKEAGF
jgi:plasmid replication initiation protein